MIKEKFYFVLFRFQTSKKEAIWGEGGEEVCGVSLFFLKIELQALTGNVCASPTAPMQIQ